MMFCTKCGKQLHDGDSFCANCGTKIKSDTLQDSPVNTGKYEEVVFNPPFRAEAERRTEQLSKQDNSSPYSSEPKRESISFNWNLDGFPQNQPRRTEDFELDWQEVVEKRKEPKPITVEKINPKETAETVKEMVEVEPFKMESESELTKTPQEKSPLSIEALERELFGGGALAEDDGTKKDATLEYRRDELSKSDEKFHTYNAKTSAFQDLLEKEKARVEELDSQRKSQWDELTTIDENIQPKEPLQFEDVFIEPQTPLVPPVEVVDVVVPPLTAAVSANQEEIEEAELHDKTVVEDETPKKGEVDEQSTPFPDDKSDEKTKLRYSDVFPTDSFDVDDGSDNGENDAVVPIVQEVAEQEYKAHEKKKTPKRRKVVLALIIFLTAIVSIELVIVGVKFIAPDSGFSKGVDNIMHKAIRLFSGEEKDQDQDQDGSVVAEQSYMDQYILAAADHGPNIGLIAYNGGLKYDLDKSYTVENINETEKVNEEQLNTKDNTDQAYGQSIVDAIVTYYNGWQEVNQEAGLVGINRLEIGQIISNENNYYILNKVTYATADGNIVEKYETVYIKSSADGFVIEKVKEETV